MPTPLRVLVGLCGVLFALQTLGWLFDPAGAAEGLGMPLLDGMGRSTQVGDFSAFFFALSALILLGAIRQQPHWLQAAALLLGGAALFRSVAWALHGADFATRFIAIEALIAGLLLFAASKAPRNA